MRSHHQKTIWRGTEEDTWCQRIVLKIQREKNNMRFASAFFAYECFMLNWNIFGEISSLYLKFKLNHEQVVAYVLV